MLETSPEPEIINTLPSNSPQRKKRLLVCGIVCLLFFIGSICWFALLRPEQSSRSGSVLPVSTPISTPLPQVTTGRVGNVHHIPVLTTSEMQAVIDTFHQINGSSWHVTLIDHYDDNEGHDENPWVTFDLYGFISNITIPSSTFFTGGDSHNFSRTTAEDQQIQNFIVKNSHFFGITNAASFQMQPSTDRTALVAYQNLPDGRPYLNPWALNGPQEDNSGRFFVAAAKVQHNFGDMTDVWIRGHFWPIDAIPNTPSLTPQEIKQFVIAQPHTRATFYGCPTVNPSDLDERTPRVLCDPIERNIPVTVNATDVDVLRTYIAFADNSGTQPTRTPTYAAWHLCYVVRINPTYAIELYDAFTGEYVTSSTNPSLDLVTPP